MQKDNMPLVEIVKEHASSGKLNIPVFPGVAVELQQIMSDDDAPLDQIARIICRDQALATKILKVSNSALSGLPKKVHTIQEALKRLGTKEVFNCLILATQSSMYKSKDPTLDNYLKMLWRHALATAIGTKWLLSKTGHRDIANEGFLAGLLHDIGKLLLLRVIENLNSENEQIRISNELVTEILDLMHVEQGYNLLEEWSIPPSYCTVVRDHHIEDSDNGDALLLCVRIANQLCRKIGVSLKSNPNLEPATLPEAELIGIEGSTLAELEIIMGCRSFSGVPSRLKYRGTSNGQE